MGNIAVTPVQSAVMADEYGCGQTGSSSDSAGAGNAFATVAAVFEALDSAGIRYCVLHGYEEFPRLVGSDIDIVVSRDAETDKLNGIVAQPVEKSGARIVRGHNLFITLQIGSGLNFVTLDFQKDCAVGGIRVCEGEAILGSRRRHSLCWVPTAGLEFACTLARAILKRRLDDRRTKRLGRLFEQDSGECLAMLRKHWRERRVEEFASAALSGNWWPIVRQQATLRRELRLDRIRADASWHASNYLRAWSARVKRVLRPRGLNVVLLGPDGAGKSSVIAALESGMIGPFARTEVRGFAPALHRLVRGGPVRTDQPHALPARSLPVSMLRAGYWLFYNWMSFFTIRLAIARNTLVLNDRHFIDILVDRVRYRYGGPGWLLRLISRLAPQPHMFVLLDAPAEVLHARKPELTLAETRRQCKEYRELLRSVRSGHVVNANQPLDRVIGDVAGLILEHAP